MSWINQISPSLSPLASKSSHKTTNKTRKKNGNVDVLDSRNKCVFCNFRYSDYFNKNMTTEDHKLSISLIYTSTNNSKYKIALGYSWQNLLGEIL
jgi:hypothetical protein